MTALAAVGDCCLDVYSGGGEFPGGNALNVAVNWTSNGADALYAGAVGDDLVGRGLRESIAQAGLDTSLLDTRQGRTGVTALRVTETGERIIAHEDLGVSADYRPSRDAIASLLTARWVHGATSPRAQALIGDFQGADRGISYDFSTRHHTVALQGLDVAFYAWEAGWGPGVDGLLDAALGRGARLALALCGEHGSTARGAEGTVSLRAGDIRPLDTCGAGDAYIARFVLARLDGLDLEASMRAGAAAAESVCSHLGAWPRANVGWRATG